MGLQEHARSGPDPEAFCERETPQGSQAGRMPPCHHGDGEPHGNPQGGWRRGSPLCIEPPEHAGLRVRLSGQVPRHPRLCHQGRGHGNLLPAHRIRARHEAAHDDGRRRGPRLDDPLEAQGSHQGHPRRDGRDDDGRHPAPGHGEKRGSAVPHHRRQRRPDEVHVRQPLRYGPEHHSTGSSAPRTGWWQARSSSSAVTAGAPGGWR